MSRSTVALILAFMFDLYIITFPVVQAMDMLTLFLVGILVYGICKFGLDLILGTE